MLLGWGASTTPFFTKGEPREAVVVWDMVHAGNWILPLRNGTEIPSKPPLFHWLGALTSLAAGSVTELTVRAPSVGLGILTVGLVHLAAVRVWGWRAALVAALALATSFEWVRAGSTARVDMTLTAFMVAAFVLIWDVDRERRDERSRTRAIGVAVLVALATLAKGPVGAALPAIVVGAYALVRRDVELVRKLSPLTVVAVTVGLAGSWYALASWQGGEPFVTKHLLQENLLRFAATERGDRGHAHPPWYLIPAFLGGMAPWTLFVPALSVFLVRHRRRLADQQLLYPLVWFVCVFVFFSISSGKRGVYLLPAYPAAALLLGAWWGGGITREPPSRAETALLRAATSTAAVVLGTAGTLLIAIAGGVDVGALLGGLLHPRDAANLALVEAIATKERVTLTAGGAIIVGLALLVPRVRRVGSRDAVFYPIAAGLAIATLLVRALYYPVLAERHTHKPFMARVRSAVGHERPLRFFRTLDYGAIYYAHRHIPRIEELPQDVSEPLFMLMLDTDWRTLPPSAQTRLDLIDRSEGTGPKGNRRLVLVRAGRDPQAATRSRSGPERRTADRSRVTAVPLAARPADERPAPR